MLPKEKKDKKDKKEKKDRRVRPKPKDAQAKAKAKGANAEENGGGESAKRRKKKETEPFRVLLGADLQTNVPQAYTDLCHPKVVAWHLEKKLLKEGAWVAGSLLAASQLKQCDDVAGTLGLDLRVDVRMHAFHQIKSWHTAEKNIASPCCISMGGSDFIKFHFQVVP